MPRHPLGDIAMTDAERQRKYRERLQQERRPHLSDHQKLAQARAEIARLRKAAVAKAEPLTDATRSKLEGELIKVKLENDRLREQLAAKAAPASSGEIALLRQQVKELKAEIFGKAKTRKKARKKARKKTRKKSRG
jgi:hypothetical protein